MDINVLQGRNTFIKNRDVDTPHIDIYDRDLFCSSLLCL